MSKYTITIKEILKAENGSELLEKALSDYPLYEPKTEVLNIPKRSELNQRLLNAYKYREIGFETVGRFLDELKNTMHEIMPYYNEMYKSVEIMANVEDPFANVDMLETYEETRSGSSTSEDTISSSGSNTSDDTTSTNSTTATEDTSTTSAEVTSNSKNVKSDTPQGNILGISANNIDSVTHASEIAWNQNNNNDTATTSGTSEGTTTSNVEQNTSSTTTSETESSGSRNTEEKVEHSYHRKGNQGVSTYAHDMNEFRTSIIDVTNMIITDSRIRELFFLVY